MQIRRSARWFLLCLLVLASCHCQVFAQGHSWSWSYGISSNSPERFREVAVDRSSGDVYAIGDADNSGAVITAMNLVNSNQAILMKHNDQGVLLWMAPVGGNDVETGEGVVVGDDGTVYITGTFRSTCQFYNAGGSASVGSLVSAGNNDIYVAAYSTNGIFQWARRIGNGNDELYPHVAVDAAGLWVFASFRGNLTVGPYASSASLSSGTYDLCLVRYDLSGNVSNMITGGSVLDDISANLAGDGTRIYAALVSGQSLFRWYTNTGALQGNSTSGSQNDHHFAAFDQNGTLQWTRYISDPSNSIVGYPNITVGCEGVYVAGALSPGSAFQGGAASAGSVGTNTFYAGQLRASTGVVLWSQWGTTSTANGTFAARDITVGRDGLVHIVGTYGGSISFSTQSAVSTDSEDLFLMTLRPTGQLRAWDAINGPDAQYASGVAADGFGGVVICGSFRTGLAVPSFPLAGPNNENAFLSYALLGGRAPEIRDGSRFNAPAAVCDNSGPIDLATWMVPLTSGNAAALVSSVAVANPANALGPRDNNKAVLNGGTGTMVLDMANTVPANEVIVMRWNMGSMASATPTLSAFTSSDNATWVPVGSVYSTTSTSGIYSVIALANPARYLRIQATTAGGTAEIDAFYYSFGTVSGGTWTGTGVSGSTFNPSGLSGSVNITYTVGTSPCEDITTKAVIVSAPPQPGSIAVVPAGMQCPGNNSGTVTLTGYVGNIGLGKSPPTARARTPSQRLLARPLLRTTAQHRREPPDTCRCGHWRKHQCIGPGGSSHRVALGGSLVHGGSRSRVALAFSV
ncbi:MAG: hypothetical protein IPL52_01355 [Flavobacteriales bacterium]|nr:hypothetical protein [Flavobacteriales bacterium]